MGCARAIAVGDSRKALYVGSEQVPESFEFGLAQLREFLGDMSDRAVVLADLHTRADFAGGCGEAGVGEGVGDLVRLGGGGLGGVLGDRFDAVDNGPRSLAREVGNGLLAADLAELANGRTGQIVVGMPEPPSTRGRQLILLGGAATALLLPWRRAAGPRLAGFDECIQVPTDTCRRQTEFGADRGRGDGALFEQQLYHGGASMSFTAHDQGRWRSNRCGTGTATGPFILVVRQTHGFHNTSVTELVPGIQ